MLGPQANGEGRRDVGSDKLEQSLKKIFLLIDFEREGEREIENIDLLFHLFMHSLVDSCVCPDQGWNPQPWCIGTTFQPTGMASQPGPEKCLITLSV